MSAYLYAIIPYKSGISFSKEDCVMCYANPYLPELKGIDSEFVEADGLSFYADFLMVNTCYRQSAFTENKDGHCWIRSEIYQIAKALGANEVWYVEEVITDEMDEPGFSFDSWVNMLRTEKNHLVKELTVDVLKSKAVYSYYHDNFADLVLQRPEKTKNNGEK